MSFRYPRIINVTRIQAAAPIPGGAIGYQAAQKSTEVPVLTAVPASIQVDSSGPLPLADSPAGTIGRGGWRVLIPKYAAGLGVVLDNDIVTDDLNQRYKVTQAYWNSLGYNLRCERLRTS